MLESIDTPSLVVDLGKLDENINKMAKIARQAGINLRPHIKTHKSPKIALQQIEAGAKGITCAKIGEAEVMVKHGIRDILIAFPIIGQQKLEKLKTLASQAHIITSLDSVEVAEGISSIGKDLNKKMPVYIEVDTGLGRVGKMHGEESLKLITEILKLPFIEVRGLMTHAGHSYKTKNQEEMVDISIKEGEFLVETKRLVKEKLDYEIPEISIGSTPTSYIGNQVEGVTEMRPGTYVFNDATLLGLGLINHDNCALTIYATVVSKPSSNRVIIDAGSKTLTSDKNPFIDGHGILKDDPSLIVNWISEEHGVIYIRDEEQLNIGDRIEIIPNHVCPTVNLTDELIGIRENRIIEIIEVEARGKNK